MRSHNGIIASNCFLLIRTFLDSFSTPNTSFRDHSRFDYCPTFLVFSSIFRQFSHTNQSLECPSNVQFRDGDNHPISCFIGSFFKRNSEKKSVPKTCVSGQKKSPPKWAFRHKRMGAMYSVVHEARYQPSERGLLSVHSSIMSAQSCSIARR